VNRCRDIEYKIEFIADVDEDSGDLDGDYDFTND
jgi:hypothetical protein